MSGRTILVPVDGSEHSEKAFDWYCDHMMKNDDMVLLLHCIEVQPKPEKRFPYSYDYYGEWKAEVDKQRTKGKVLLHHFGVNCNERKIKHRLILEHERPDHTIIRVVKEEKVDVIVIGARGLGTIRRTVLGSVSDFIVHHSPVPVTVVPPEAWRHHYPHLHVSMEELEIREQTKTSRLNKTKITNTTDLQSLNKQFCQEPYVPPRLGIRTGAKVMGEVKSINYKQSPLVQATKPSRSNCGLGRRMIIGNFKKEKRKVSYPLKETEEYQHQSKDILKLIFPSEDILSDSDSEEPIEEPREEPREESREFDFSIMTQV